MTEENIDNWLAKQIERLLQMPKVKADKVAIEYLNTLPKEKINELIFRCFTFIMIWSDKVDKVHDLLVNKND